MVEIGTNSIGWVLVNKAENEKEEKSSFIKFGLRVNTLTIDEYRAMKPFILSFYE